MDWRKESYRSGQHSLNRREIALVLNHTRTFTERVLLSLAVATGIRRGDIVRLLWSNVDWEQSRISFYERKKRRTRTVYLSLTMLADLRRLKASQDRELYLFPGRSEAKYGKGHMSDRKAWDVLNRALDAAGLDRRPFHSLRATCIKMCQEAGWSVSQAAEHVGDTVRVVQEHYLAPSDSEMKQNAVERPIL